MKAKTPKVLKRHVSRRAFERFGIRITDEEMHAIVRMIQKGEAKFHDRQSTIVTRWVVPLRGINVAVAYDKKRGMIRTVMPVAYLDDKFQLRDE